jgi:LysM repeat protein
VAIRVENVTNLYGVQINLSFDPALLQVVDADPVMAGVQVELGPFLNPDHIAVNEVNPSTGFIDFAYSSMAPTPVSGSGVVATITFQGVAPGTSSLTFNQILLADIDGNPIPITQENGQVTVGGAAPTPIPTGTPAPQPTPTHIPPAETVLTFSPLELNVGVGETVPIVLQIQNAVNLYGVEVHLAHGTGADAVAITPGPCLADLVAEASVEGNQVDYAASLQSPSMPVNGDCNLATIEITGLAAGSYSLEFVEAILSDSGGNEVAVTTQNGVVLVGAVPVTPTPVPGETPTPAPSPSPSPTPPPDCEDILGHHVVQRGETLYAIGRAYGVRPFAIASCNGIVNPSLIHPGTRLAIPNVPWSPIPPGPIARRQFGPGVPECRAFHTVQPGETLFRISLQYGVSMWAIAEANNILNLNFIRAGQVLCIP